MNPLHLSPVVVFAGLCWTGGLAAQSVEGRVVDAASRSGVPGAEVRLVDDTGGIVARELAGATGEFALDAPSPGRYRLAAGRYGYADHEGEAFVVEEDGLRDLRIELEPRAIELAPVVVRRRLERLRHEPTYGGLYARHQESPSIGNNRVLLRTDPEFRNTISVRDLYHHFRPMDPGCAPYVFWNGFFKGLAGDAYAEGYLDISTINLEGVEYYRDYALLPLGYRPYLPPLDNRTLERIRRCGVIALWPRR